MRLRRRNRGFSVQTTPHQEALGSPSVAVGLDVLPCCIAEALVRGDADIIEQGRREFTQSCMRRGGKAEPTDIFRR